MKAQRLIARLTAACIAIGMLFGGAASADSITVNADRLNMRREADASSKSVGIVTQGEALSFVAEDGDWYQVRSGNKTGFVLKSYVTLDEAQLAADAQANTVAFSRPRTGRTTGRVNMRSLPITSASAVKVVPAKASVEVIGECGVWYQVKYSGKTGYIMARYLSVEESSSEEIAPSAPSVSADTIYVTARQGKASERVNLRAAASASSDVIKVLDKKDSVLVLGENGSFYLVSANGKTGYVSKEYIAFTAEIAPTQPSAPEGTDNLYASALTGTTDTRVNMREEPSTSADVVKVVSKNRSLTVLGENGSWYKVRFGGKDGYVSKEYITLTSSSSAPSAPSVSADTLYASPLTGATSERVNLREEANASADVVKVLSKKQSLTILGENGSWYKVKAGGKTGYVSKSYVTINESDSSSAPSTGSLTVYSSEKSGKMTARVNLRASASTSSDVVKVLSKNAAVTVLGEQGSFYQVRIGSLTGFVSMNYVSLTASDNSSNDSSNEETGSSEQDTIYSTAKEAVTTVKVNLRREPEGDVLATIPADASILLIGERGGWYLVSYNSRTGYVSKSYVSQVISAPSSPTQPDSGTSAKPDTSGKGTTAYITGSVNLRTGPGTSYGIVRVMYSGEEITYYSLNDGWYMIKAGSDSGYVSSKYVTTTKPSAPPTVENVSGKVQQADWWTSGIQKIFARGVIATVTDVDTGLSWQVIRSGGTNHADVQPLTAADTAKMKQAYGGTWSWNRRAIWVTINGVSYAASMNGMPHGTGSITTNNFDGHHCIHFLNSRTHTGNRWDTAHQSMVQKAYKAGQ